MKHISKNENANDNDNLDGFDNPEATDSTSTLLFKNVPKSMEIEALRAILTELGVRPIGLQNLYSEGRARGKNSTWLVECANDQAAEQTVKMMFGNHWKIQVIPKYQKEPQKHNFKNDIKTSINIPVLSIHEPKLHPRLNTIKIYEYQNESSEKAYFKNRRLDPDSNIKDRKTNINWNYVNVQDGYKVTPTLAKLYSVESCHFCKSSAVTFIECCHRSYCSSSCLRLDIENHGIKCKGENQNIERCIDPYQNLRGKYQLPRNRQKVIITHIEKSNLFFIRSVEKLDNEQYLRILNLIGDAGRSSKQLNTIPKPDSYVIAQHEEIWWRATVLSSVKENKVLIAFPDLGHTSLKSIFELKEFPNFFQDLKQFVFPVYLRGVKNVVLNDQASLYLYKLKTNNTILKLCDKNLLDNRIHMVDLVTKQTKEWVNQVLSSYIIPKAPSIHDKPLLLQDIKFKIIKPDENVDLIILDNSFVNDGFISCIMNNDAEELEKINNHIIYYARKAKEAYTPRESEICLVKVWAAPLTWYRAICEIVSGNGKPGLTFLDYGNICEVSYENIRQCPRSLNLTCFTNTFYIKGLQKFFKNEKITKDVTLKLQDILKLYSVLTVPKIEIINESYYITLPTELIDRIKLELSVDYDEKYDEICKEEPEFKL